jgi:hypothetical protein
MPKDGICTGGLRPPRSGGFPARRAGFFVV